MYTHPPAQPKVIGVRLISSPGPIVAIRSLDSLVMIESISDGPSCREDAIFAMNLYLIR
jgi:hypothetical protein